MVQSLLPRPADRIALRRLRVADLAEFQAYRCDPDVGRYQGWQSVDDTEAMSFLDEMTTATLLCPGQWCQIGIAEKQTDRLIGDIGLCVSADGDEAEIGFSLDAKKQGLGLAREAIYTAIQMVFDHSGVHRIVGITDARNLPSIRLMTRIGMRKTDQHAAVFRGEPCVEYVFVLLRNDIVAP